MAANSALILETIATSLESWRELKKAWESLLEATPDLDATRVSQARTGIAACLDHVARCEKLLSTHEAAGKPSA